MQRTGNKTGKRFWTKERYLQILALLFVIALSVFIFLNREEVVALGAYGYLGIFLISIITCSSIVVPVPGWILVATLGAILNPILVGVVSGIGGTIGEMTGYLFGLWWSASCGKCGHLCQNGAVDEKMGKRHYLRPRPDTQPVF